MSLNTFIFGHNARLEITLTENVDEIKLKLSKYSALQNPVNWLYNDHEVYSTEYVVSMHKTLVTLFFAKDVNRRWTHNFSEIYPHFAGEILDTGSSRQLVGDIGISASSLISAISVIALLMFFTGGWLLGYSEFSIIGEISVYALMIHLIFLAIHINRATKKVDQIHEALTVLFKRDVR